MSNFNPRSRVGSDRVQYSPNLFANIISIHAPVWGATLKMYVDGEENLFQSTLPCGERRVLRNSGEPRFEISIHAPVWGATRYVCTYFADQDISIHAPVWGATSLFS